MCRSPTEMSWTILTRYPKWQQNYKNAPLMTKHCNIFDNHHRLLCTSRVKSRAYKHFFCCGEAEHKITFRQDDVIIATSNLEDLICHRKATSKICNLQIGALITCLHVDIITDNYYQYSHPSNRDKWSEDVKLMQLGY